MERTTRQTWILDNVENAQVWTMDHQTVITNDTKYWER